MVRASSTPHCFRALADHKVGEQPIFPGTGFIEIALCRRAANGCATEQALLADFEILKPLDLSKGETREIMSRVSPNSNTIEIFSRPRLSRGGLAAACARQDAARRRAPDRSSGAPDNTGVRRTGTEMYQVASSGGLHYGPAFRLVDHVLTHENGLIYGRARARIGPHGISSSTRSVPIAPATAS